MARQSLFAATGLGGLQTGATDASMGVFKPHGEQRPTERRILGDLSNTAFGLNDGKRQLLDPRTPQPARRPRDFEVFTGGENATGVCSASRASSPPQLVPKSRADPFSMRTPRSTLVIEELEPLGSQDMLPDIDNFCQGTPSGQDRGHCWQPLWEDGPSDPLALADGLARTAEMADLEAQRQDALLFCWPSLPRPEEVFPATPEDQRRPINAWPSSATPQLEEVGSVWPSPPSAVPPFRMDIDFDMDESDADEPQRNREM